MGRECVTLPKRSPSLQPGNGSARTLFLRARIQVHFLQIAQRVEDMGTLPLVSVFILDFGSRFISIPFSL